MSRPVVLFGGPSPEHDISILTGLLAARTLAAAGQEVDQVYWSKGGELFLLDGALEAEDFLEGVPRKARALRLQIGAEGGLVPEGGGGLGRKSRALDVTAVLNCCHGGPGEDGSLQAALDLAGIRYTGPSAAGAALGMDKLAFAATVSAAGLPHLPCVVVDPEGPAPFDGPYIVKPRLGGSSIGIETFDDWASLAAFCRAPQANLRDGAVVEPFRPGIDDVEIAVRAYPDLQLSAASKPLRGDASILGYREKYVGGEGMVSAPRQVMAADDPLVARVREAATTVAKVAGVRGVARVDFLLDGDDLFVNEINTIPGSLTKHLWVDPPVPFATLLGDLLAEATRGPARAFSTQGADGSALRSAGSISSKLA